MYLHTLSKHWRVFSRVALTCSTAQEAGETCASHYRSKTMRQDSPSKLYNFICHLLCLATGRQALETGSAAGWRQSTIVCPYISHVRFISQLKNTIIPSL